MPGKKNVIVMGLGYVGCVSAAGFAELGHNVLGVDRDINKVEAIRKAHSPFFEAGLDDLIETNVSAGRLHAGARASLRRHSPINRTSTLSRTRNFSGKGQR